MISDPIWLCQLSHQRTQGRRLSSRPRDAGRRCRPHSQPRRRAGHEHGHAGRLQPRLEVGTYPKRPTDKRNRCLTSYSIERSAVGDQVLKNAERFTTLATLREPIAQWLRNHIAPIVEFISRWCKTKSATNGSSFRSTTATVGSWLKIGPRSQAASPLVTGCLTARSSISRAVFKLRSLRPAMVTSTACSSSPARRIRRLFLSCSPSRLTSGTHSPVCSPLISFWPRTTFLKSVMLTFNSGGTSTANCIQNSPPNIPRRSSSAPTATSATAANRPRVRKCWPI